MRRCYDAVMPKTRTTVTIDEGVMRALRVRAARTGRRDSEVIEDALRKELGLDLFRRLRERDEHDLTEEEATALAVEAQHATRPKR
jgi:plasmid stability protein